ncbi:hypothetical protein IFR05_003881, partial [Cadophora sp. M221]
MADSKPLPVILFGKLPSVTTPQAEALLPEIEVIHLISSLSSARTELPSLLSSPTTTHPPSQQGKAAVIVVGGGFSDEEFEELRGMAEKGNDVVWLRADNTRVPE